MTREAVRISGLRVRYAPGENPALTVDALSVAAGERLAVIGPVFFSMFAFSFIYPQSVAGALPTRVGEG